MPITNSAMVALNVQKGMFIIHKGICTTLFTAAFSVIAKIWNEPRGSTTEEWVVKM